MRKPSVKTLVSVFKCSEGTARRVRTIMSFVEPSDDDSTVLDPARALLDIEQEFSRDPGSALHFITHGVEDIGSKRRTVFYLNTGEAFASTILLTERYGIWNQRFYSWSVGSWGDIVESSGNEFL